MKKIIALTITAFLLIQSMSLTACSIIQLQNGNGSDNSGNGVGNTDETDNNGDTTNGTDSSENGNTGDGDNTNGGTTDENNTATDFENDEFKVSEEKLSEAFREALDKVDYMMTCFDADTFPAHNSVDNVYPGVSNTSGWNQGFYTGILWHAYEMTGENKYEQAALAHIESYTTRIDGKLGTNTHDMGFLYSPSCVAAYKLTGNQEAKEAAIKAADNLVSRYHEKGQFIQAWGTLGAANNYRLIVDCLMNIPLLYWATEVTGDETYRTVAVNHYKTTLTYAFREDGSTYHTYFFDPETGEPLRGETHQGASDDSTWSRGQAWAMYGPILTYIYEEDEAALEAFCNTADYFLANLPSDYVPYWDLSFKDGAYEPKDSSAAAISVCALLEGAEHLDESDPRRTKYISAAHHIMNSLIDNYTTKDCEEANGLLLHATYNKNSNTGVDEMNIWGDYFYMEALNRMISVDWDTYW